MHEGSELLFRRSTHMKRNRLIISTIICVLIALFGIITYQRFLAVCVIVLFCLAVLVWYVIEKLSAIQQSVEKTERYLDEMQKSRYREPDFFPRWKGARSIPLSVQ